MTEASMLWATSTTGDGAVTGYSEDSTTGLFHRTLIGDLTAEGPLKNYLNELGITATNHAVTPYVTRATGAAWLYGFHYWDAASLNINLTLPVVGDTGFRVVLRATHGTTRTVRADVVMNTDGVSGIPALTQTAGTLWEISLASGVVDTSGDIWTTAGKTVAGVTDLREFVHPNIEVVPAMVADRTRQVWVDVLFGRNVTDGTDIALSAAGFGGVAQCIELPDNKLSVVYGQFVIPADFDSEATVKAVVLKDNGSSTTNIYANQSILSGACGEEYDNNNDSSSAAAHALVNTRRNCIDEVSLANAAAGDMARVQFIRSGTHASDTVSASVYVLGFVLEYTADG